MSASEIGSVIVVIFVGLGACFHLLGAIGILRFPDVYLRSHAATKSTTLGVVCILVGAFIYFWIDTGELNGSLLLGLVFVFITAPVGGHLIGRAAYRTKVPLWGKNIKDELKEDIEKK